jgi:HPt (histidine-containing phosphotransfer) domain-containing protein
MDSFDPEQLAARCGDDLDFQREIVGDFLSQLDPLLERAAVAVASRDAGAVREAAHALRGSALSVDARPLAEASARLESLGRSGDLAGAETALEQVRHDAARLRGALDGFLGDRAA